MSNGFAGVINMVNRFRMMHGELGYRRAMNDLHARGQMIVEMFERGDKPDVVILKIAVENYLRGKAYEPTSEELRAAQVEFIQHVREIRQAFEKAMR